jgi:hypothetical protein
MKKVTLISLLSSIVVTGTAVPAIWYSTVQPPTSDVRDLYLKNTYINSPDLVFDFSVSEETSWPTSWSSDSWNPSPTPTPDTNKVYFDAACYSSPNAEEPDLLPFKENGVTWTFKIHDVFPSTYFQIGEMTGDIPQDHYGITFSWKNLNIQSILEGVAIGSSFQLEFEITATAANTTISASTYFSLSFNVVQ